MVTLSNGWQISARLVVMANGLNIGIRHKLGMTREMLSECHSISIGFDVKPVGPAEVRVPGADALFRVARRAPAYLTLFPIGAAMRANLFAYRTMNDPWLREFRQAPQQTLFAAMPGLRKLMGDFEVTDRIQIRPVDLYATKGHRQPGVVLLGDAFCDVVPRRRHRRAQGAQRRGTAVQRPHPALARDARHGRGQDRRVL